MSWLLAGVGNELLELEMTVRSGDLVLEKLQASRQWLGRVERQRSLIGPVAYR